MNQIDSKGVDWINLIKVFAIIGAVFQHLQGFVYENDYLSPSCKWAVPLFLVVGGYNAYISYQKRGCVLVKKRIWRIIIPHFFSVLVYIAKVNIKM